MHKSAKNPLNIPAALLTALFWLLVATSAGAQQPQPGPSAIAARLAQVHPKTVIFVFDVTMSTRHGGVFQIERAATSTILRKGCVPGDHVILISFGTSTRTVFDRVLASPADAVSLLDLIPPAPEPGRGTNIRLPHHQALERVESGLPEPGAIILLTDSFNDSPAPDDPNMASYNAYYSPKGLTVYPHTPENADYERLLRTLKASGKLYQFGVGVGIAPSGRPIERIPTMAESDDPEAATASIQLTEPAATHEARIGDRPFVVIGCFSVILIGLIWAALALAKPTPVRLILGDRGMPRDYRLKSGARVCLGGALDNCRPGDDFFPLAGLPGPSGYVTASGGGLVLTPLETGNAPARVFHNGVPLELPVPLKYGDEIRVSLAPTPAGPPQEFRIRFADPKAPIF